MQPSPHSLPERIYRTLSADIRQGLFKAGERLPTEPMLCERYGVSRTALREAIARLKADGLVDVQQGRGTFVRAASGATAFRFVESEAEADPLHTVQELAELRLGVEVAAASLAALRRTPEQLARLKASLDAMEQAVLDRSSGSEADLAFHATIAQATGNRQYRQFMEYLRGSFGAAIETSRHQSAREPGFSQQAQAEHRAIYEAIADQNARRAEQAMRRHILALTKRIEARLREEGASEVR